MCIRDRPSIAAVLATVAVFKAQGGLAAPQSLEGGLRPFEIVRVNQIDKSCCANLAIGPAENLPPGRIRALEESIAIGHAEHFWAELPGLAANVRSLQHLSLQTAVQFPQASFALA